MAQPPKRNRSPRWQSPQIITPLSKSEYRAACIQRSAQFQNALLTFHQTFPRIVVSFGKERGRALRVPEWLRPILIQQNSSLYKSVPQTIWHVEELNGISLEVLASEAGWAVLGPEDGPAYFNTLTLNQDEYDRALDTICRQWPTLPSGAFVSGQLCQATAPSVLIAAQPFEQDAWVHEISRVATGSHIMIPIYPNTTKMDIDWEAIRRWKALIYRQRLPRVHEHQLARRIKIWDMYQEQREVAAVARELHMPVRTVAHHLLVASKDITGALPQRQGRMKERRMVNFNPDTHIKECARCQRTPLCPAAKAFVNQDTVAQREIPTDPSKLSQ
jgi:hypothetical protein